MADNNNTSTTQHITQLDFDITKAEQQLEELAKKVDVISKEIAGKNWTIKAVIEGNDEFNQINKELDETINKYNELNKKISELTDIGRVNTVLEQLQADLKLIKAEYANVTDSVEGLTKANEKYAEIAEEQKKKVEILNAKLSDATAKYGEESLAVAKWQLELTNAQTALQLTNNAIEKNADMIDKLNKKLDVTNYDKLNTSLSQLQAELALVKSQYADNKNSMEAYSAVSQKYTEIATAQKQKVAELESVLEKAKKNYGENSAEVAKWQLELTNSKTALQNTENALSTLDKQMDEYSRSLTEVKDNTENMTGSTSKLVSSLEYALVNAFKSASKAAVESMKTVEDSMMEISRVLNLNGNETNIMRDQMLELGQAYGRSFEEVAGVTLRYAQAGYDMNDSLKQAEQSLLAVNTAELNVEQATQSLIGIMAQWGYEADDLSSIIDKLNYTADNNAITTQDLVDGLLKASSMAKTAGISFDDTIGILTAMKVASGAAGKEVGNAFKSILAYIQRPESLKLFDSMGIEVYADKATGALKPMVDILQQMSDKWNEGEATQNSMIDTLVKSGDAAQLLSEEWATATGTMDEYNEYLEAQAEAQNKANDAEARAQAQAAAGVFRRNYYISLMENWNKAIEVSADLVNAEGHSMAENGRYMETLTAKCEQLKVALTDLAIFLADAGFLDAAKNVVEFTTNLVSLTSQSKAFVPIILSLGSAFLALKIGDIIKDLQATKTVLQQLGETAADGIKYLTGASQKLQLTATSAEKATAAITGVSVAISAVSAAISIVIIALKAYKDSQEKEIENSLEMAKAAENEIKSLDDLLERYNQLYSIADKTTEQDAEYKDVQEKIITALGDRASALKGLTENTEAYRTELEKLVKAERDSNLNILETASKNAKKNVNAFYNRYNKSEIGVKGAYTASILSSVGTYDENNNSISMGSDNFEQYINLKKSLEALNDEYIRLATNGKAESKEYSDIGDTLEKVRARYDQLTPYIEKAVNAEAAYREELYLLNHEKPKTYAEQKKMNDVILATTYLTDDYKDMLSGLITQYYDTSDALRDFNNELKNSDFAIVESQLEGLAATGNLNSTALEKNKGLMEKLAPLMREYGLDVNDVVQYYKSLYTSSNDVSKTTEEVAEEFEGLADKISNSEKSISSLNGYMQTLREGGSLTAEQVLDLCDTYGLLANQFVETENGYKIEISALEALRNAQIEAAVTARQQQIEQTMAVQTGLIDRLKAYGLEVEGIQSVADAEKALTELRSKKSEDAKGIKGGADAQAHNEKYANYNSDVEAIEKIGEAYKNLDNLASGVYEHLGEKSSSTNSSAQKDGQETVDILKQQIEAVNHIAELGGYTLEEQIGYFERLKRELELTEEQYKELEETLDKLYEKQIKEYFSDLEEQYDEYLDNLKEQFDEEVEAYKDSLDKRYDARKKELDDEISKLKDSLNAQISTAKTAYQTKKKYAEKAYDGQIEALKKLRDAEIDNIEAAYNAQIDALNKIKRARQEQRDEEDYQDERNGILEQISYWEQRTGTEAVENIANLKKQLADLDKNREREKEDTETDNQIDNLKTQMQNQTDMIKSQYDNQIALLQLQKQAELESYEETYNREVELLQNRLETETKLLEEQRDRELERLKADNEKKYNDFKKLKEDELKAEKKKWEEIKKLFNEANLNLLAGAKQFAPQMYEAFHNSFTNPMKRDLQSLQNAFNKLRGASSLINSLSGTSMSNTSPTSSIANTGTYKGNLKLSSKSASSDNVAQARTGGYTLADGLTMLHKNELVVNPQQTRDMTEFFNDYTKNLKPVVMSREILDGLKKMAKFYNNAVTNNNVYNNGDNITNSGANTVVNFNAPLQNIEHVGDEADARIAANNVERMLKQEIDKKY